MLSKRNQVGVSRKMITLLACFMLGIFIVIAIVPHLSPNYNGRQKITSYHYERHDQRGKYLYEDIKTMLGSTHDEGEITRLEVIKTYEQRILQLKQKELMLEREIRNLKSVTTETPVISRKKNEQREDTMMKKMDGLQQQVATLSKNIASSLQKHEEIARVTNNEDIKACNNPFVLFLVTSHSSNYQRRKTIRETWAKRDQFSSFVKMFNLTYDVYFSVGKGENKSAIEATRRESRNYGDMLIINREEDFYDLTRRVMAGFKWTSENCLYTYLFKVDDDVFISIPNVMSFLSNDTFKYADELYAGDMNINAAVNRNENSKYVVHYNEWPVETYPPYCSGGGFVLSRGIINKIIPYFDWVDPYKIDDAYVGILIQRAKIRNVLYYKPSNKYEFWFYGRTFNCTYIQSSIVHHKVTDYTCMRNLTLTSLHKIPSSLKLIDEFRRRPPPLHKLPKAKVFGRENVLPKVQMVVDIEG
jgi:Galactosyltransferase.